MELQGLNFLSKPTPPAGQRQGPPSPGVDTADIAKKAKDHEGLVKAARQFEAVFMNQLMKAMRKTVPEDKLFNSSGPVKFYQQMQDAELAKAMTTQNGGMGIANLIVQQLTSRADQQTAPETGEPIQGPIDGHRYPDFRKSAVAGYRSVCSPGGSQAQRARLRALASSQGVAVADTLRRFEPEIKAAAAESGLPPELLLAVVMEESGGDPQASSDKGAQGLMQLMPATAADMGVKDRNHPGENLQGGARYLSLMMKRYDGDLSLALAAYNAGPGNVDRAGRAVPAFQETRNYVDRVLKRYGDLGGGTELAMPTLTPLIPGPSPE